MSNSFEVLNPWAEADPIPQKGLAPRLQDLSGKKIGLLYNYKRASQPILREIQEGIKRKFSSVVFSWYSNLRPGTSIVASPSKSEFEDWVRSMDAVVGAVGD
jgi:hypothetical protein